jgi:hypothetical protein
MAKKKKPDPVKPRAKPKRRKPHPVARERANAKSTHRKGDVAPAPEQATKDEMAKEVAK